MVFRLVGDKYNAENDIVTIVTDRCPLKKQNYDYAMYLITALYHESRVRCGNLCIISLAFPFATRALYTARIP